MEDAPTTQRISIVSASIEDPGNITVAIQDEDHTLGNALRDIIMRQEHVELCAYSIPHPSENKIHVRIQTDGEITALEALSEGLANLADISNFMADKFDQALQERKFEVSDETNW